MVPDVPQLGRNHVDRQSKRAQFIGDEILCRLLLAGEAGELYQRLQELSEFAPQLFDRTRDVLCQIRHDASREVQQTTDAA